MGYSQDRVGNGIVSIKFNDKTVVRFYELATSSKPVKTVEFFNDESIDSYNIKNLKEQQKWLKPESLWLDYYQFQFRCLGEQNGRYEVIVNNETGQSYWIAKNTETEYVTWEEYLKGMFSVGRATSQEIYTEPNIKSDTVPYKGTDCFVVKAVQGYWIEIFTDNRCDDGVDRPTSITSGWVRWRDDKELLLNLYPTS
jgi:hypothetical protein